MLLRAILIAVGLACIPACQAAQAPGTSLEFQIEVRGALRPDRVSLESDGQLDPVALKPDVGGSTYSVRVDRSSLLSPGARTLSAPVQLVMAWPAAAESLYLNIGPTTPSRIRIGVVDPSRPSSFNADALNAIDGLGGDFESILQRYLMARRFHRFWRYTNNLPNHDIAIRSARIWFDALTSIVKSKPMLFAGDQELASLIDGYKKASLSNPDVKRRFLRYFPAGLVLAANNQLRAVPFSVVAQVPKLVQSGQLLEAQRINTAAMATLDDGDDSLRTIVRNNQGVTADMLQRNDEYISTLLELRGDESSQDAAALDP